MSAAVAAPPANGAMFRTIQFGEFVDIELRADGDGREFEGIAVPWEVETDLDGWAHEVWTRGAFNHQLRAANRVSVGNGHIPLGGDLIGALREMKDDSKGLYVRGRISDVVKGNEAITLMTDKALRELSIGFYRVPGGDVRTSLTGGGVLYRMNKANLFEVALVPWGQYGRSASVSGLRTGHSGSLYEAETEPARRRIATGGVRRATIMIEGVEVASFPIGPELPAVPAEVPAPIEPAEGLASIDAVLTSLPELEFEAE